MPGSADNDKKSPADGGKPRSSGVSEDKRLDRNTPKDAAAAGQTPAQKPGAPSRNPRTASGGELVPSQRPKAPSKRSPGRTPGVRDEALVPSKGAKSPSRRIPDTSREALTPAQREKTTREKDSSASGEALGPVRRAGRNRNAARENAITLSEASPDPYEQDDPDYGLDTGSPDFNVKFDFEGKYRDVPEERPLRWRREKRTGCIGGILYSAFIICISILLASLAWMAAADVLGFGTADEEVNMTIPKDFTIDDVVELLYDAQLIKYKFLFRLYAGFSSADSKIIAGSYVLNRNFDYRALVHGMTTRGGARVEVTVQIPEGYTMLQIFALLEESNVCDADELWRSATWHDYGNGFLAGLPRGNRNRLEGYLFPDTYNFYVDSKPEQAISKMLGEFGRKFNEQYTERAEEMGYTLHEILTVASMIEREAGTDEERPHIASVIYNRLNSKDFPRLEIDATIYYAISGTGKPFSTDFDSPYNTYRHPGLPPGPISNPGLASIRAALYPSSSNDYYYALNKSGSHDFFRTYAQHQAFVQSDEYGGG